MNPERMGEEEGREDQLTPILIEKGSSFANSIMLYYMQNNFSALVVVASLVFILKAAITKDY